MGDRDLKVRLSAEGESKVKQAIDGTTQKAKQSAREQRKAAREAAQAAKREAQEKARAEAKAAKDSAAAAKKAEQEKLRAAQQATKAAADAVKKAEQEKRREFERTRREQERQERRRQRTIAQMGGGFDRGSTPGRAHFDLPRRRGMFSGMDTSGLAARFGPAAMGAMALGGLERIFSEFVSQQAALLHAVEQRAGVQDVPERQVTAMDFELGLTRLGGELFAGQDPEEVRRQLAALEAEITAVAAATNRPPGELLTALQTLQTEFSAGDFGRANLRALGDEATRTGTNVEQLARFSGLVRAQFGEMDVNRMLDITAQGGLQGALSPEQLSGQFADQLGLFRSFVDENRTQDPEQLFRQFVAMANVLRSSGANASESATLAQNLMSSLSNADVQNRIALATGGRRAGRRRVNGEMQDVVRGGVQLSDFRHNGQLDIAGYVEALAGREGFGSLESLRSTIGDQQASIALNTLIARRRDELAGVENNADLRELMGVSAEAGARFRSEDLARTRATEVMRAEEQGVAGQIEGIARMKDRSQVGALALQEQLTKRGAVGQFVANNETAFTLANLAQGSTFARALENPALRSIASMIASPFDTSGGPLGVLGGAWSSARNAKGGAGTGTSNALAKREIEEALHARPLHVIVDNAASASPGGGEDGARRNEPPRARSRGGNR